MSNRSSPNVGAVLAVLAAILLLVSALSVMGEAPAQHGKRVPGPQTGPAHPMALEIQNIREAQAARLLELNARAQDAQAPVTKLAIQREIQHVKLATEMAIFEAQLSHAEGRGDQKTAARIRQILQAYDKLTNRLAAEDPDAPAPEAAEQEAAP